jgi:3-methyl-2-oxobutanoate hydroxymethyltransferase
LLEAVPPEVSQRVVAETSGPIIGCGAGPACHGHVIVTHDAVGLSTRRPKFVPELNDLSGPMKDAFAEYARRIQSGEYPAAEHEYEMPAEERKRFLRE